MNLDSHPQFKRLTRFLCQELLYEYVSGRLEKSRERAVEEYMAGCRDTQREFQQLERALKYVSELERARISPKLAEALAGFEPQWKRRLQAWSIWSSQRGWRMLPYFFLVMTIATGLVVVKPWQKDVRDEVILAEQIKQSPDTLAQDEKGGEGKSPTVESTMPVEKPPLTKAEEKPAEPKVAAQEPAPAPATKPTQPLPIPLPKSPPQAQAVAVAPQPEPPARPPAAEPATSSEQEVAMTSEEAESEAAETDADESAVPGGAVGGKGVLYRGHIVVSDFHNTWPAVRDKIQALGGKVAGNVELGWLRRPDEAYFHFTLPESNQEELESFLGTFGPVQFHTERHPRVMPRGQIRIILTVKEKDGVTNESETETP